MIAGKHAILRLIAQNDGELGLQQIDRALENGHAGSVLPIVKELLAKRLIREEKLANCQFKYFICASGADELEKFESAENI